MVDNVTREEMWARQTIKAPDVNYDTWKKKKKWLQTVAATGHSCLFAVDVYKGRYIFASENFSEIFGYDLTKIKNIEQQGDFLEERIHPDDRQQMIKIQIEHSRFIYTLPPEERNDYQTIYQFRMLNKKDRYINVITRQEVLQKDRRGKAWIIWGVLNLSPDQQPLHTVRYSYFNKKTGKLFTESFSHKEEQPLTKREKQVLYLIREGLLSKEIADKLTISIHTVNNHRKNILAKLKVSNSIEAINRAEERGIIESGHPL